MRFLLESSQFSRANETGKFIELLKIQANFFAQPRLDVAPLPVNEDDKMT